MSLRKRFTSDPAISGNGFAETYTNLGIRVTATATARASSNISQEDANNQATARANELAMQQAISDKNVIEESTAIDGGRITSDGDVILKNSGQPNETYTLNNINDQFDIIKAMPNNPNIHTLNDIFNNYLTKYNSSGPLLGTSLNGPILTYCIYYGASGDDDASGASQGDDDILLIGGYFNTLIYMDSSGNQQINRTLNSLAMYNLTQDMWMLNTNDFNAGIQINNSGDNYTGICYSIILDETNENIYVCGVFDNAGKSANLSSLISYKTSDFSMNVISIGLAPNTLSDIKQSKVYINLPVIDINPPVLPNSGDLIQNIITDSTNDLSKIIITSMNIYNNSTLYVTGYFNVVQSLTPPFLSLATNFLSINLSDFSINKGESYYFDDITSTACKKGDYLFIAGNFSNITLFLFGPIIQQSNIAIYDMSSQTFLNSTQLNSMNGIQLKKLIINLPSLQLIDDILYIQGSFNQIGYSPSVSQYYLTSLNVSDISNVTWEYIYPNTTNDVSGTYTFYLKTPPANSSFTYDPIRKLLFCYAKCFNPDNPVQIQCSLIILYTPLNNIVFFDEYILLSSNNNYQGLTYLTLNYTNIMYKSYLITCLGNSYIYSLILNPGLYYPNYFSNLIKLDMNKILNISSSISGELGIIVYVFSELSIFYNSIKNEWTIKKNNTNGIPNIFAITLINSIVSEQALQLTPS